MFSGIKDILTDYCKPEHKILNIGCGNSSKIYYVCMNFLALSEDMYKEGYKNITNIDWSIVCISYMQTKYEERLDPSFTCKIYIYL